LKEARIPSLLREGWRRLPPQVRIGLVLGLAIRLALAPFFGHHWDSYVWGEVARELWAGENPYQAALTRTWSWGFYCYPPPWMLWCAAAYPAARLSYHAFLLVLKTPLVIADTLLALLLLRFISDRWGEARGSYAFLAYFLNPLSIYVTAVHGMFDSLAVLLGFAGLLALIDNRQRRGALLLGAGAAVKLYTAYLLPLLLLREYKRSGWKSVLYFLLYYSIVPVAFSLPFFLIDPFAYLYAILFGNFGKVGFMSIWVFFAGIASPTVVTTAASLLTIVVYLLVLHRTYQNDLIYATFALLCTFLALSPKVSPQYVIWILPQCVVLLTSGKLSNSKLLAFTGFPLLSCISQLAVFGPGFLIPQPIDTTSAAGPIAYTLNIIGNTGLAVYAFSSFKPFLPSPPTPLRKLKTLQVGLQTLEPHFVGFLLLCIFIVSGVLTASYVRPLALGLSSQWVARVAIPESIDTAFVLTKPDYGVGYYVSKYEPTLVVLGFSPDFFHTYFLLNETAPLAPYLRFTLSPYNNWTLADLRGVIVELHQHDVDVAIGVFLRADYLITKSGELGYISTWLHQNISGAADGPYLRLMHVVRSPNITYADLLAHDLQQVARDLDANAVALLAPYDPAPLNQRHQFARGLLKLARAITDFPVIVTDVEGDANLINTYISLIPHVRLFIVQTRPWSLGVYHTIRPTKSSYYTKYVRRLLSSIPPEYRTRVAFTIETSDFHEGWVVPRWFLDSELEWLLRLDLNAYVIYCASLYVPYNIEAMFSAASSTVNPC